MGIQSFRFKASQEFPTLAHFQTDDLDAFDSDCDDIPSAKAVLMANLSSYDLDVLLEVIVDRNAKVADFGNDTSFKTSNSRLQLKVKKTYQKTVECMIKESRLFEHGLYKELKETKAVFNQMETKVAKCSVDKKYFEIEKKELSLDNDRLLEHIICQDVMNTVMHVNDNYDNVLPTNNNSLEHDNSALELLKHENNRLIELLISQYLVHTAVRTLATINDYKTMQQSFVDEYNETLLKAKNVSIVKLKEHIANIKGKNVVDNVQNVHNSNVVTSKVYKLDFPPLSPCIKNNMVAHELLVYVSATCPSSKHVSDKLVAVTPMNRTRKVSSTEAMRSKPRSNTKKDRISQTSSSNKTKNKVEDQPRIAKSSLNNVNRVSKIFCNENVKHSVLNVNFELICATCHKCMFDAIHDLCVSDYLNDVHARVKSKSVKSRSAKSKKKKMWKPTGRINRTLVPGIGLLQAYDRTSLSAHQLRYVTIPRVYYVEGLRHNFFSVGQLCDLDLEVAFRKHTYYVWNLDGDDLLSGSRDTNLYTISLDDMLKSSSICLLSKASKTKAGLPKLKFKKDHLCSACDLGKSKNSTHKPKADDSNQEKLYLLHMDICGPMHVENINRKKYILVIVDDYSRFTLVKFFRSNDEAPKVIIKCLKKIQVRMNATVCNVRTDNGTEFVNQTLLEYYENFGISHQTSVAHTP
ncbi:retrovirus-related pol polyprotein from transposon TNT 1-94 [Tanacetum coccineum]